MLDCKIDGCDDLARTAGLCVAHHRRFLAYGDPLARIAARGAPREFIEMAIAYEGNTCLCWPFSTSRGRAHINQDGRGALVSRIVCDAVRGAPPTRQHEAAHACGFGHKGCITPRHLFWETSAENAADMIAHGTSLRGERSSQAKLTTADVIAIRSLAGAVVQHEIAERFGISASNVSAIIVRRSWAHVA
jgi:hypothetical protein